MIGGVWGLCPIILVCSASETLSFQKKTDTEVIYTSNNVEANARQNHELNLRLWGRERKFISSSNYSDGGGKANGYGEGVFTGKSSLKVVEY